MSTIRLCTSNARGLSEYTKRRDLFHNYRKKNYQVIFLQETHSTKEKEKCWNTQWGSKIWFSHGISQARGVAILFAKSLNYEIHNVITDEAGRYILLYCTIEKHKYLLSNIYALNVDDVQFIEKWMVEVKRFTPEYIILGGDFNFVMELDIDKQGGRSVTHSKSRDVLVSNMDVLDLVDAWRIYNTEKQGWIFL